MDERAERDEMIKIDVRIDHLIAWFESHFGKPEEIDEWAQKTCYFHGTSLLQMSENLHKIKGSLAALGYDRLGKLSPKREGDYVE